jgi:hypothetical protein
MSKVFLPGLAVNEQVIKEYQQVFPQLFVEHMVHARLKCGWGIG